jgi:hypothetical protein
MHNVYFTEIYCSNTSRALQLRFLKMLKNINTMYKTIQTNEVPYKNIKRFTNIKPTQGS